MYLQIARRKDFECAQYKEMINIWSNEYANYPDHCTQYTGVEIQYHTVAHEYVQLLRVN